MGLSRADEAIGVLVVDDHAVVRRGLLAFLDSEPDLEVVGRGRRGRAGARPARVGWTRRGGGPTWSSWTCRWRRSTASSRPVRSALATHDVEVVALTSFAEEERVHAALEAGASGYLLKDADADEVAAAVRAAHRGELQLDPRSRGA